MELVVGNVQYQVTRDEKTLAPIVTDPTGIHLVTSDVLTPNVQLIFDPSCNSQLVVAILKRLSDGHTYFLFLDGRIQENSSRRPILGWVHRNRQDEIIADLFIETSPVSKAIDIAETDSVIDQAIVAASGMILYSR